jgi:hypothetical protein
MSSYVHLQHVHACLMRSYIEVLITRSLLNTKYSVKYKDKNIIVLKNFKTVNETV